MRISRKYIWLVSQVLLFIPISLLISLGLQKSSLSPHPAPPTEGGVWISVIGSEIILVTAAIASI